MHFHWLDQHLCIATVNAPNGRPFLTIDKLVLSITTKLIPPNGISLRYYLCYPGSAAYRLEFY
ncbi:hypothetical protein CS542_09415 [Pedobacter sp. IW39]|nr:hypothetical protein CS542_09415 [Pedobacter sp. IW39]